MNGILLCEGSTDFVLMQYFLREVYGWEDQGKGPAFLKPSRELKNAGRSLVLGGTGGCSQMLPKFQRTLERNKISAQEHEFWDKIVMLTDRDEEETEETFLREMNAALELYDVNMQETVSVNRWLSARMENARGEKKEIEILLLMIPIQESFRNLERL